MNIVLTFLIAGVCGSLLVAIPFLLKFLCEISHSLRRLYCIHDFYFCMTYQRLKDHIFNNTDKLFFPKDIENIKEEEDL